MNLSDTRPYFVRNQTQEQFAILDRALAKPRICSIFGPDGSGKTALFFAWWAQQLRPKEIFYIVLAPSSGEYRSETHMVYARLLDAIYETTKPAYAPSRSENDTDGDRFGKKQLETLRKKVVHALRDRPCSAFAIDRMEYSNYHALQGALNLRYGTREGKPHPCRTVFLIGQPKKVKDDENLLATWLNRQGDTRQAWLERIDLQCPTLEEIRGTREQPGLFKKFLDEGIKVMVPEVPDKPTINVALGELAEATKANLSSLARLVDLIDDEAEEVPGATKRHITLAAIQRVRARLGRLSSS